MVLVGLIRSPLMDEHTVVKVEIKVTLLTSIEGLKAPCRPQRLHQKNIQKGQMVPVLVLTPSFFSVSCLLFMYWIWSISQQSKLQCLSTSSVLSIVLKPEGSIMTSMWFISFTTSFWTCSMSCPYISHVQFPNWYFSHEPLHWDLWFCCVPLE